jgi:peptidoglycan/xylan/chitin deacetylase (PgdA/CDA1 family)
VKRYPVLEFKVNTIRLPRIIARVFKLGISLSLRGWDIGCSGLLQAFGRTPKPSFVILYYHGVDEAKRRSFARQMDQLCRRSCTIPVDAVQTRGRIRHYCGVTFDDGFVSAVENALPELERRGIPVTLFIPTGSLGQRPQWIRNGSDRGGKETVVSPQQLVALRGRELVTIGSHSVSHPSFLRLADDAAARELSESKSRLEAILERPVKLFSFPHGHFDKRSVGLAKAAGYSHVYTIVPEADMPTGCKFAMGRLAADPDDWPIEFHLKILGAYRWMAHLRRDNN